MQCWVCSQSASAVCGLYTYSTNLYATVQGYTRQLENLHFIVMASSELVISCYDNIQINCSFLMSQ